MIPIAETNFPNGVSIPSGHVGSVMPIVTTTGLRQAAGSAVVAAGSVNVSTGLTTVSYAQVTSLGPLSSTAGTAGGFVVATVAPIGASGGSICIRGYDALGTISSTSGTVWWHAIGT